jgi:hypothetical protein
MTGFTSRRRGDLYFISHCDAGFGVGTCIVVACLLVVTLRVVVFVGLEVDLLEFRALRSAGRDSTVQGEGLIRRSE